MIPANFQLMGRTIRVRIVPKSRWQHEENCVGYWAPDKGEIHVVAGHDEQLTQQIFCHELTHAILDCMNHKLARDEPFVDTFAGLLQQAWTTVKPRRKRK